MAEAILSVKSENAVKKEASGCWQCDEFEKCDKLDFLILVHNDAPLKNLRIIKKKGMEEFLKGKRNW